MYIVRMFNAEVLAAAAHLPDPLVCSLAASGSNRSGGEDVLYFYDIKNYIMNERTIKLLQNVQHAINLASINEYVYGYGRPRTRRSSESAPRLGLAVPFRLKNGGADLQTSD